MWKRRQKREAGSRLNSLAVDVPMLRRGQSRGLAPRPSPGQRGASAGPAEASSAFHSPAIGGRASPATIPADRDFGICSCQAERQEEAGKGCWSQPSHRKSQGQLCTALQEPGTQGGRRSIRRKKCLMVTARPPGPARWTGKKGGRSCPLGRLQLLSPRASGPLPGQEPWAPLTLLPGGRVQMGSQRKGCHRRGLVGRGWAQSP